MDSTHATQPALPGEQLRVTPELRWARDPNWGPDWLELPAVLEQKWISSDAARFEWRAVPGDVRR